MEDNIMKKVNLILDMDGVLINSIEVQKKAFYGSYMSVVGDSNCPDFSEFLKHTGDFLKQYAQIAQTDLGHNIDYFCFLCCLIDRGGAHKQHSFL